MASNDTNDEKPNLRPTKRVTAGGKSIFLHHNPNQPSNKSYIHATWKDADDKKNATSSNTQDPFGIERPHVEYSLNKQQRWEVLNDFRRHMTNQSSTSSSGDELDVQSDSQQQQQNRLRKKKKSSRRVLNNQQTKYRLYEFHNTDQQANCVSVTSNTGQQRTHIPKKTYMQGPLNTARSRHAEQNVANVENDDERQQGAAAADVTYYAVVPPPKEKQLANIRKQHNAKGIVLCLFYPYIRTDVSYSEKSNNRYSTFEIYAS